MERKKTTVAPPTKPQVFVATTTTKKIINNDKRQNNKNYYYTDNKEQNDSQVINHNMNLQTALIINTLSKVGSKISQLCRSVSNLFLSISSQIFL